MRSFKTWLDESEGKNLHMYHLDELVFIEGVEGARRAVNYLRDFRNTLTTGGSNTLSVKFDGAPALFFFVDPQDGKVAIAKKGVFNKNPKFYKTQADIDADLSGELHAKFTLALKYLPELGIKSGFYQGDLMFTTGDVKSQTIDGKNMLVMHPNTIAYAVDANSDIGHAVARAKIGIVFHTTYTGKSIETMSASFGKPIVHKFKKTPNVWAVDATFPNDTKAFALSDQEAIEVDFLLKDIGIQFQRIKPNLLNRMKKEEDLRMLVLTPRSVLTRASVLALKLQPGSATGSMHVSPRKSTLRRAKRVSNRPQISAILSFSSTWTIL
jgi:hypothetical protein